MASASETRWSVNPSYTTARRLLARYCNARAEAREWRVCLVNLRFGALSAVSGTRSEQETLGLQHIYRARWFSLRLRLRELRAHLLRPCAHGWMWHSRGRNSRGICLTFRRRHRYCSHYAIARRRNVHFKQRAEDVSVSLHFLGAAEVIGEAEVWSDCFKSTRNDM